MEKPRPLVGRRSGDRVTKRIRLLIVERRRLAEINRRDSIALARNHDTDSTIQSLLAAERLGAVVDTLEALLAELEKGDFDDPGP